MKKLVYLLANSLTLIFALYINYLSGTGAINGMTVAEVSAKYENLFTPAGYAFAIWGLIYLLLLAFVGFQWYSFIKKIDDDNLMKTGLWFSLSNLANGFWIYAWMHLYIGISVIIMLVLLFSLIILMFKLRLETWDAPVHIIAFVWWPVCIYLGWIVVATVANFSAYFISIGWEGGMLSQTSWALIMIGVATIIYSLLIYNRNMREAALVGVWALVAIAVKQWELNSGVAYGALTAAGILLIYVFYHAFKNRSTLPFEKIRRGEI